MVSENLCVSGALYVNPAVLRVMLMLMGAVERDAGCALPSTVSSTKSSGESGLPWKTPDPTGKASVCQPLKATRAVVPACRMCSQHCAPAPTPTAAMHCLIHALPRRSEAVQNRGRR